MTAFVPGQTVRSRNPVVSVDPLPPGRWRFRLVVVDNDRNESAPTDLTVEVLPRGFVPTPFNPRLRLPIRPNTGAEGIRPDISNRIRPVRPIR
jgi:hypothetical protein